MKPIKKFSAEMNQPKSILESLDSKALDELIKGMGFKDIHELKKEKALLSKLEALLKEVNPKEDVSEDDSKEIEDEIKKKGEPESIEGKTPSKVADVPTSGINNEDEEEEESEEEEEAEAADVKKEVAEVEEEAKTTPKATRKVMTFEDFIQEETKTVNKNVSYRDDEDEEDNALPVADSEVININIEDEEEDKTVVKETGSSDKRAIRSFSQFISEAVVDKGPALKDENKSADNTVVPIVKGDGSKTATDIADEVMAMGKPEEKKEEEGEELVTKDQKITKDPETSKDEVNIQGKVVVTTVTESHFKVGDTVEMSHGGTGVIVSLDKEDGADDEAYYNVKLSNGDMMKHAPNELTKVMEESVINEEDITTDEQFKEYAFAILQKAFGDEFDEAKAQEVVDGLTSKYSGDYGAMVGALQSTMGS